MNLDIEKKKLDVETKKVPEATKTPVVEKKPDVEKKIAQVEKKPSALDSENNLPDSDQTTITEKNSADSELKTDADAETLGDGDQAITQINAEVSDAGDLQQHAGNILVEVADEAEMLTLTKDIKYLPGPQLPSKISATFDGGVYVNRKLLANEKFYKYHGTNNVTGRKYAWLTNKKYTTELELRQKLAIRDDWGVQIEFVTEFDVPLGTWVSEGKAAGQGVGYPGQDYQAVITNTPNTWIIKTSKAF